MSTTVNELPECNPKIFRCGACVALVQGEPGDVEAWVRSIACVTGAKVDWHTIGGYARVLHLGFSKSRQRVRAAIDLLEPLLRGKIIQRN